MAKNKITLEDECLMMNATELLEDEKYSQIYVEKIIEATLNKDKIRKILAKMIEYAKDANKNEEGLDKIISALKQTADEANKEGSSSLTPAAYYLFDEMYKNLSSLFTKMRRKMAEPTDARLLGLRAKNLVTSVSVLVKYSEEILKLVPHTFINKQTNLAIKEMIEEEKRKAEVKAALAAKAARREEKKRAREEAESTLKVVSDCAPAKPTKAERMHNVSQVYSDYYEICTSYMIKAQDLRLHGEEDKARNLEAKVKTMQAKLFNNDAKRVLIKDENPDYGRKDFSMFIQPYERDEEGLIKIDEAQMDEETLARIEDKIGSGKRLLRVVQEAAAR